MNTIINLANLTDQDLENEAYRLKMQAFHLYPEHEFRMLREANLVMISNTDKFEKHEFMGYIEGKGKVLPCLKYSQKADRMNLR